MPTLDLSAGNSLAYEHTQPTQENGYTFVFFNALTGDKAMWQGSVIPALSEAGHGHLIYNLRGQAGSDYSEPDFTVKTIVADAMALLEHVGPVRPVHVGLSIGGLFGVEAHQAGGAGEALGLVFLNTLRCDGPRLAWINDAAVRMAELGGADLLRDLYSPLLMNDEWQAANRSSFLGDGGYTPMDRSSPVYHLLKSGGTADWNIDWESISIPVLNVSGTQDRVFLNPADVDAICERLPDVTRVELHNCGHMVPVERPAELATAMLEFAVDLQSRGV